MINLKTTRELRYMRDAGKISQEALLKAGEAVRPGVSTLELDKIVRRTIEKAGRRAQLSRIMAVFRRAPAFR